ncbi:MAG: hypothetical protein GC171_05770 [Terrimonas sp.]|nr:hypothetical protein [Terrimonas sp.]
MKYIIAFLMLLAVAACSQQTGNTAQLQAQIDSLQNKLDRTYKPGFGEFMSSIQVHHNKLWFAGTNGNWKLADFEINEIKESLGDIKLFCTDRPEANSIGMIEQPLQNVSNAIQQKSITEFKSNYTILTSTCNSCHQATQHEFNIITIPTAPPYTNQSFKPAL